jgi:hypothetical protein
MRGRARLGKHTGTSELLAGWPQRLYSEHWLVRLAKFRARFADTMVLYFLGQLANWPVPIRFLLPK